MDKERDSFLGQQGLRVRWDHLKALGKVGFHGVMVSALDSKGIGQVQLEIGEPMLFCFSFSDLLLVVDFFLFQSYSEMPTQIIKVFNQLIHLAGRTFPCANVYRLNSVTSPLGSTVVLKFITGSPPLKHWEVVSFPFSCLFIYWHLWPTASILDDTYVPNVQI